jgi:hypothetical protein
MAVSFIMLLMAGIVAIFLFGMIAVAAAAAITQRSRSPHFLASAPDHVLEKRLQTLYTRLEKVERFQRSLVIAWLVWALLAFLGFIFLVTAPAIPAWLGFEKGLIGMSLYFVSCLVSTVVAAWMKRALHQDILELGYLLDGKCKNDELAADKPKREYTLGDDGELVELEDDSPLRGASGERS